MGSVFSAVSALRPVDDGRFEGEVDADWTIGGKPNGGYLLAMLGRVAVEVGAHPHVLSASAVYLRSPAPGPVTVEGQVLRTGRSASQLRARMGQEGRACVEALFTTAELRVDGDPYWAAGAQPPEIAEFDSCLRVPGRSPLGVPVAILDQVDLRLDPATAGFARGAPTGRGELRGWLSLPGEEPFDPVSLLYAVDALPPATFDVAPTGWVPTLELTVYIRALPAAGPVRVLHKASLIDAEKVDEACLVWDGRGRLVAQATQLAGVRLG